MALAKVYAFGGGIPENNAEAVKWSRLAAEQGYAIAQSNLECSYANRFGVPQNYVRAYVWWSVAAAHTRSSLG